MVRAKVESVIHDSKAEATVLVDDRRDQGLTKYRPVGIGARVDLHNRPSNQTELLTLLLERVPEARRGRLQDALTLEHRGVVIVMDTGAIVVQRRGPHEFASIFDYSAGEVQQAIKTFFEWLCMATTIRSCPTPIPVRSAQSW
jgi:hypothetical protein